MCGMLVVSTENHAATGKKVRTLDNRVFEEEHIIDGVDINEYPPEIFAKQGERKPVPFSHPIYRYMYPNITNEKNLDWHEWIKHPFVYQVALYTFFREGMYPDHVIAPLLTHERYPLPWAALDLTRIPNVYRWQVLHDDGMKRLKPAVKTFQKEEVSDEEEGVGFFNGEYRTNAELIDGRFHTTKYSRKLFIGNLYGQSQLWSRKYVPLTESADAVIGLGNYIRLQHFIKNRTDYSEDLSKIRFVPRQQNNKILTDMRLQINYPAKPFPRVIGANEMIYLNLPREEANNILPEDNVHNLDPIRDAWLTDESKTVFHKRDRLNVALVVDGRLVTHAGLSYGEWLSIGAPVSPFVAADRLNEKYFGTLYQGQCLQLGDGPNMYANPIMAHSQLEVYASWLFARVRCPFDQIHGSTSLSNPVASSALHDETHPLGYVKDYRLTRYGSVANICGTTFTAVDPGIVSPHVERDFPGGYSPYIQRSPVDYPGGIYTPPVSGTPAMVFPDGLAPAPLDTEPLG